MEKEYYERIEKIKARLSEIHPPPDMGLIELQHSVTALTIISGIGVLGVITFIIELMVYYRDRPFRKVVKNVRRMILQRQAAKALWGDKIQ